MGEYKVLSFNEQTGQLIVEFAKELSPFSVDVPVRDGLYITGEELDSYIKGFAPIDLISRQQQINSGIGNASELHALVEQTVEVEVPSLKSFAEIQAEENRKMWADLQFEKKIAKALVKFGVLQSDPTEIPVSEQ